MSCSPPPPLALSILLSRLRACRSAPHALQCHALLLTSGHLAASPLRLSNLLLLALASASAAAHADAVFARLPEAASGHAFPWNTLIRLHAPASPRRALAYFARMRRGAVDPDAYTFPAVLKACGCGVGLLVHAEAVRRGLDRDLFTRNALISFYCRAGDCRSGRRVFDDGARDLVSWNSMVAGHVWCGEVELAQELFDEMPHRDAISWAAMIDAYGKLSGGVDRAREEEEIGEAERGGGEVAGGEEEGVALHRVRGGAAGAEVGEEDRERERGRRGTRHGDRV